MIKKSSLGDNYFFFDENVFFFVKYLCRGGVLGNLNKKEKKRRFLGDFGNVDGF